MGTFYGTPNNTSREIITGTDGDDYFYPLGGWDIVQGGGGFDTVFVVGQAVDFNVVTDSGVTYVNALSGASKGTESAALYDVERIVFSDQALDLTGSQTFYAEPGSQTYVGNAGLDQMVYTAPSSHFIVEKAGDYHLITDLIGDNGVDRIKNVERVLFSDQRLALDLDGAARDAARIIGTLLGPASVTGSADAQRVVGLVLGLLDDGQTLAQVSELAVTALGWNTRTVVEHLYLNVLGRQGSLDEVNSLMAAVAGMTATEVTTLACDLGLIDQRIDLVGLQDTGLSYLPFV